LKFGQPLKMYGNSVAPSCQQLDNDKLDVIVVNILVIGSCWSWCL